MAAPVAVQADISHTSDTLQLLCRDLLEELLPHGSEVDQVARLSQIFLSDLQFHHVGGLFNLVEDSTVWLTRLEVERSVLGLQDNIRSELPVERFEFADGLLHTVLALMVGSIDEAAPHDDAAKGL